MKILGLIPARGGSKGVPRKNIKLLQGKPLIQYTIDSALSSGVLVEVMVSTEDQEIASIAKSIGANIPFMRPLDLATDKCPTIDVVLHVLEAYQKLGREFDGVCLLQPTNPLRQAQTIREAVHKFEESNADSLISVRTVPHEFNPHWTFEENAAGFLKIATGEKQIITRRQDLPNAYYRDGEIYLTKSATLIIHRSLYGEKTAHIALDGLPHINIDTKEDWVRAEQILCAE